MTWRGWFPHLHLVLTDRLVTITELIGMTAAASCRALLPGPSPGW